MRCVHTTPACGSAVSGSRHLDGHLTAL